LVKHVFSSSNHITAAGGGGAVVVMVQAKTNYPLLAAVFYK
jgi:hypothetical protein